MKIDRALALRDRAQTQLADLFNAAPSYGMSHERWCERRNEILEPLRQLKAPHWVFSYLDGYCKARTDALYREFLVFGGKIDGRFYSVHRDRPDYYEKHGIEPSAYADDGLVQERGHYWGDSLKPWFV